MRAWSATYTEAVKQIKLVREAQLALRDFDEQVLESKRELAGLAMGSFPVAADTFAAENQPTP